MRNQLNDLDELVLKCRDEEARNYIKEAVLSYKAGAFRASIVATWIAVLYDLLGKFRELSLTGDKEAEKQMKRFEKARTSGNISEALKIENEILSIAREKFELISLVEKTDLSRLQADRNRCAHPSMVSSDEPYEPPAELARYHLLNAVEHLLKQQPVQGKSALERLKKDVSSDYFPTDDEEALEHLKHGPLAKPKKSLLRNFVIILLKKMIYNDLDYKVMRRYGAALNATREMHRDITEKVLSEKLSELFRTLDDKELDRIVEFLRHINDVWHFIEKDMQEVTKRYIKKLNGKQLYSLTKIIEIESIKEVVIDRISRLNKEEAFHNLFLDFHPLVNDRRIELYTNAKNYDQANDMAGEMKYYISEFTKEQIERLIEDSGQNSQVRGSFELASVINKIRDDGAISEDNLNELLRQNNLKKYIPR